MFIGMWAKVHYIHTLRTEKDPNIYQSFALSKRGEIAKNIIFLILVFKFTLTTFTHIFKEEKRYL